MAGGFDKFVNSVNRGITTINVKTSSSLEKSKIKTHIDTLNADIAKLYSLTGEMMYYKWKNNRDDLSDVYEKFEVIRLKFEEIEKLNQEMVQIDEKSNGILVGDDVLQAGTQPANATPQQQPPVGGNVPAQNVEAPVPPVAEAPVVQPVQTPVAPPVAPAPQPAVQPVAQPVQAPPPVPVAPQVPVAPPAPPTPVGIVCPNCGSEYKDTVKFCRKCGTRLQG